VWLNEPAPRLFDFESTALAHGWVRLRPFTWDAPAAELRRIHRLVATLGEVFPGRKAWRAFPTAEAIAAAGERYLAQEVRLGYRSRYLWQLAADVAESRLELQTLEDPQMPLQALRQNLLRITGIGSYAAATLLMSLGRYGELAIDSQMRAFVAKKYFQGQAVSVAQVRETYAAWGKWQYLAYWFDP
jgi:3-methyladenine DNA glycosylase/8-oxoguanine DNA glycosylase